MKKKERNKNLPLKKKERNKKELNLNFNLELLERNEEQLGLFGRKIGSDGVGYNNLEIGPLEEDGGILIKRKFKISFFRHLISRFFLFFLLHKFLFL